MSLDRDCCMQRGRFVEPRSSLDTLLDEHYIVGDAETSDRGLSADDVEKEESDSDGPDTTMHGYAGWVYMRPCKRQMEGDHAAANECGCKRSSPLNNVHISMHMHMDKDGILERIGTVRVKLDVYVKSKGDVGITSGE